MFERIDYEENRDAVRQKNTFAENYSAVRRQYLRAREYCGYTLDEIINSRSAQRYLSEIWLLGCMVRTPRKADSLPDRVRIADVMPEEESLSPLKKQHGAIQWPPTPPSSVTSTRRSPKRRAI